MTTCRSFNPLTKLRGLQGLQHTYSLSDTGLTEHVDTLHLAPVLDQRGF